MENNDIDKYLVPGLLRGLKILESFTPENKEMNLSQIAELLDINRSSAFRLVQTLEYAGFLKKTPHKTYSLDVKVLHLGYNVLSAMAVPDRAMPIMQRLRDETGMAVHLSILENTDILYINNVQALGAFTSNIRIGTRWPAYATVIGQLLLTSLSDEEIQQRFEQLPEWTKFSDSTATNIQELLEKVSIARESKYLISWKKFRPDMIACAAPILNQQCQTIQYALSISCPATNVSEAEFEKDIVPKIIQAANEISLLTY